MAPSRYSRNKKKGDKVLNWAIGVVSVLILVIGGIILVSLLKSPSHQSANQPAQHQKQLDNQASTDNKSSNKKDSAKQSDSSKASNAESDTTQSSDTKNTDPNNPDSNNPDAKSADSNDNKASAKTKEDVPDDQHRASYDKGSADWNAQVAALSAATSIPANDMIIYWLGNGGDPNSSIGRVSSKETPNKKFVVKLEYQDQQWQAVNVQNP